MIYSVIAAIAAGGAAFFAVSWWIARRSYRSMTAIERANAQIEEDRRRDTRLSWRGRVAEGLATIGYRGSLAPIAVGAGFCYLAIAGLLTLVGFGGLWAALAAAPIAILGAYGGLQSLERRRLNAFNSQLMQALELLAGQLEGGSGIGRALEQILPSLHDPLRREFEATLDKTVAAMPLVEAMQELAERYPSGAMDMFVAALELDRRQSVNLSPAIRQAAAMLRRNFELTSEGRAEIAQTRLEFFIVSAIIGGIIAMLVFSGDPQQQQVYRSGIGLVTVLGSIVLMVIGFVRARNIFRAVSGEL